MQDTNSPPMPDKVFLFSGHMIDRPDRAEPRFPADKESIAASCIAQALDNLGAGPCDLAYAQGAAGGDILFAEACLARGLNFQMLLPFPEAEFIAASILPSANGEAWRQRYLNLRQRLTVPPRLLPDDFEARPSAKDGSSLDKCDQLDPYARCNLWLLSSALSPGFTRLRFICLWNGGGGDGPGGTAHMVMKITRLGGKVTWLDTRELW